MNYDVIAKANTGDEMTIYFSSHALLRIEQRFNDDLNVVTSEVSTLLLESYEYIQDNVRFNYTFLYVKNNRVFVCIHELDSIYVVTAFSPEKEPIEHYMKRKKMAGTYIVNADDALFIKLRLTKKGN